MEHAVHNTKIFFLESPNPSAYHRQKRRSPRRDFLLKDLSLKRGSLISNFLPSDTSEDEFEDYLFDDDYSDEDLLINEIDMKSIRTKKIRQRVKLPSKSPEKALFEDVLNDCVTGYVTVN